MNQYLVDTKYAAQSLIDTIHNEENRLSILTEQFDSLKKVFDHLFWDYSTADMHEDFNELQVQHKFIQMAKFAEQNDLKGKKAELDALAKSILAKKDSMNSLSMSLLQIAKQGISTVHGAPSNCPPGRSIGSETLKNVIWQGRNQSIHCEEGNPNQKVKDCFSNLANDFGNEFDLTTDYTANKARKIIDLLTWRIYDNYENDMITLIG
ncbi:hypothetical protein OAV92_00250 [Crocinitomicaceae bacterium]|nr:hypothetical protein [Crocinitomicaceae bacterium]